jgi:HlyD family secretion protein
MKKPSDWIRFLRRLPRWAWIGGGALLVVAGAVLLWSGGGKATARPAMFAARRGPLEVAVLEGGSLQALESQEVKCEVRVGYQGTKILKIVEEGYGVTDDDIKTNKVLVELDSSELQKQLVQEEIQFQSAVASLIDAQQSYEIQINQNLGDVKDAEQKARFARMDFDKFLGDRVTAQICEQSGLDKLLAAASTNNVEDTARAQQATEEKPAAGGGTNHGPVAAAASVQPAVLKPTAASASVTPVSAAPAAAARVDEDASGPAASLAIDFVPYANIDKLGDGEAKQKLRKFEDDLQVAQKELGQAKTTLEGTRRLFDKGFVTKTDLERDAAV